MGLQSLGRDIEEFLDNLGADASPLESMRGYGAGA
jgi:hypothetical protein